jgi:hypothetical protein
MKNAENYSEQKSHENEYLRKKRLAREKTLFTRKNTLRLIFMSLLLCGAFVLWAERTGFEGERLFINVLGFFMMFAGVIALALVGAIVLMLSRKLRGGSKSSFLYDEITEDKNSVDQGKS